MNATSTLAPTLFSGLFAVAASALILGFAAGPAHAASISVPVSTHELATAEGRATVDARIARAAKSVCDTGARDVRSVQFARVCVAETIEASSAKLAALKSASQLASR